MKRYTYSMLLNHPWLKPLAQAATVIEEEDESESDSDSDSDNDDDDAASAVNKLSLNDNSGVAGDAEVAAWVTSVLERKKSESAEAANAASTKPALHAAPLAA